MSVAVIGGGWAGLAAAVSLAGQGIPVTLFESAAQLGGRARRVEINGLALDNGQHILIGAYRETLRLLASVGVDVRAVCHAPPLTLQVTPDFFLRAAALPAPWHLGLGLLRSRGIPLRDKLSAVRFLAALKRGVFSVMPDISVSTLLAQHLQSPALNDYLWHPLCLAALNTPPQTASAQIFVNVLRDAFFGTRDDSRLVLPRVDLGQLLPDPAAHFIAAHGGKIRLNQRIQRVELADKGFTLHSDQGVEHFMQVICAVPPFRVCDLLGQLPSLQPVLDQIAALQYQPIYTVYLQYAASMRLPFPMLGLSNTLCQWVFDRGALSNQHGLMAVVISAEGEHEALPHAALAEQAARELHEQLGFPAQTDWTRVIAEKRATFTCLPSITRPDNVTPIPGLFLAGDYTDSDYPATLESAVRSGIQCALSIQETVR
ncbi:MAG: FAD-dependent oxidoreductase [Hydrogenophilales bacterium]|nr:FAD-dependent oxidoreductase [Hydrogenophilales bacterium]